MHQLVLASQSPRRKKLLEEAGFIFRTDIVKVSEFIEENLNISEAIEALARTKAEAWVKANKSLKTQSILVLSADTVVVHLQRVLGKPQNPSQAHEYLTLLSGKTHSVITGFCLWDLEKGRVFTTHDETKVNFKELSEKEIQAYIATGEPMDKAGAYAIQGEGGQFVKSYEGSWTNVVGLPMELLEKTLLQQEWQVARK